MSEDLISSLKSLKEKLNSLEDTYDTKFKSEEKRSKIHQTLEKKLENLVNNQNERIKIEAGGKTFETSKSTIINCPFDNLLKEELEKDQNIYKNYKYNNNGNKNENKYFIDLDSRNFKIIIDFLRYISDYGIKGEKYLIALKESSDEELIKREILYFFKENEKIFEVMRIKSKKNKLDNSANNNIKGVNLAVQPIENENYDLFD